MNKGTRRGHRRRRQSYLQQRGARNTLDGASGLSSVSIKRYGGTPSPNQPEMEGGASLLTAPPGRRIVARAIVGNFDLTSSTGVDGVDLVVTVGCVPARVGYSFAAGRVGKPADVVRAVVGDVELSSSAGFDGVDLPVSVGSVLARVGYPLAAGRVGRVVLLRSVVGNFDFTSSTSVDGVDLEVTVGSVLARVDYLFAAGRVGRFVVARIVVGKLFLTSPASVDSVDLAVTVGCVVARIDYLFAAGRVGRVGVARSVVGEFELTPTAGLDGVDLGVVPVVALIGYLAGFARKGRLRRLGVKKHHQSYSRKQSRRCHCQQRCPEVI